MDEVKQRIEEWKLNPDDVLDLSSLDLEEIPNEILSLHHLTHLDLSFNQLTDIQPIQNLINLTQLDLSRNLLTDIQTVQNLINLTQLNLSGNPITDIQTIQNLINLTQLNLTRNQLTDIQPIQNLINLSTLHLLDNQITDIQPIQNLENLKQLDLSYNQITDIQPIQNLENLKQLALSYNQITDIQPIQNLENLKQLDLSDNQIIDIQPIQNLINLTELNIWNNQITDIQPVQNLINLTQLDLSYNQITDIQPVQSLINLTQLDLSHNQITDIQPIQNLENLNYLDLSHNQITDIQPIQNLENLNYLNLSDNEITDIQPIQNLVNLQNLDLSNNQLNNIEQLKLLACIEHLTISNNPIWKNYGIVLEDDWDSNHASFLNNFLKNLNKYVDTQLPYNVITLGNHGAGKSRAISHLIDQEYKQQSTHGLTIHFSKNLDENGLPNNIYYDFGGQDFYHGIYRLFLKSHALKIMVVNPENNQNNLRQENIATVQETQFIQDFSLNYWINQIKFNELLQVDTTQDFVFIQSHYCPNEPQQWEYTNCIEPKRLLHFSALDLTQKDSYSIKHLKEVIEQKIISTKQTVKLLPERIQLTRKIIQDIKSSSSSYEPYQVENLKKEFFQDEDSLETVQFLLEQLHASGLVFYNRNIQNGKFVWLNPVALVQYLYNDVFHSKYLRNSKKQGVIPETEFKKLKIHSATIKLLTHHQILFKHQPHINKPKEIEYIVPNFLPLAIKNDPYYELTTFGLNCPTFTLKFDHFIPMGMINHFICFFGKQPECKVFWRDLIIFTLSEGLDSPYRVMLYLNFSELKIKAYIQGHKNHHKQVCQYIFYCLMRFFYDIHAKDATPATYAEFHQKPQKDDDDVREIWKAFYNIESPYFPKDLHISLNEKDFISYQKLNDDYYIQHPLIESEQKNLIPVQPFSIFTEKEFKQVKKVFISYSRKDVEYKNELNDFLKPTLQDAGHEVWDCGDLEAGKWDNQIKNKLEESDLVIFMLSMNFFNSGYILKDELIPVLKAAEENKKKIMCIVVKNFPWGSFTRLAQQAQLSKETIDDLEGQYSNVEAKAKLMQYQFLPYRFHQTSSINPDKVERITPLNNMTPSEREEVYVDILERIQRLLNL